MLEWRGVERSGEEEEMGEKENCFVSFLPFFLSFLSCARRSLLFSVLFSFAPLWLRFHTHRWRGNVEAPVGSLGDGVSVAALVHPLPAEVAGARACGRDAATRLHRGGRGGRCGARCEAEEERVHEAAEHVDWSEELGSARQVSVEVQSWRQREKRDGL